MVRKMFNLVIDILIYNYTPYKSFFFLLNINDKSLLVNIIISLFIDFFITHTFILITLYVVIIYFLKKAIHINYHNILFYYLFNILIILVFYSLFSVFCVEPFVLLNIIFINSIYILISYKRHESSISLIG